MDSLKTKYLLLITCLLAIAFATTCDLIVASPTHLQYVAVASVIIGTSLLALWGLRVIQSNNDSWRNWLWAPILLGGLTVLDAAVRAYLNLKAT